MKLYVYKVPDGPRIVWLENRSGSYGLTVESPYSEPSVRLPEILTPYDHLQFSRLEEGQRPPGIGCYAIEEYS